MYKKMTKLGWRTTIDGKEYGTDVKFDENMDMPTNNAQVKEVVDIVSEQMLDSLQQLITGKFDSAIEIDKMLAESDEAEKRFHDRAGVKKGE